MVCLLFLSVGSFPATELVMKWFNVPGAAWRLQETLLSTKIIVFDHLSTLAAAVPKKFWESPLTEFNPEKVALVGAKLSCGRLDRTNFAEKSNFS